MKTYKDLVTQITEATDPQYRIAQNPSDKK
jgi:hypothetical protein